MIDSTTLQTAAELRAKKDAAYLVFKKQPTVENSARWTVALGAFNDFCVNTITSLLPPRETSDMTEEILANLEDYKTCKSCSAELVFAVDSDQYIASNEFMQEFPGWCYSCLVEHCKSTDCTTCTVSKDPSTCAFKAVKDLHVEAN